MMVQAAKKQLNEGERCSVLLRYLCLSWLVAEASKRARRPFVIGKKEGLKCVVGSDTNAHLTGIFGTGTPLTITTTFGIGCYR